MKPPTTNPMPATPATPAAPTTTEGFAPVNTKLEALSPMNVRTLGSLPLATAEMNHPQAGPDQFLLDQTAIGGAN